jgi:hypothetical protein
VKALARFAGVSGLVKELTRNQKKQTPAQRASRNWSLDYARSVEIMDRDERKRAASDTAKFAATDIGEQSKPAPSIAAPPLNMPMPKTVEQAINDPAYGPQCSGGTRSPRS